MKPSFYAVAVGKARGIYSTWAQCSEQVTGYPGSVYKAFRTLDEARSFLAAHPLPSTGSAVSIGAASSSGSAAAAAQYLPIRETGALESSYFKGRLKRETRDDLLAGEESVAAWKARRCRADHAPISAAPPASPSLSTSLSVETPSATDTSPLATTTTTTTAATVRLPEAFEVVYVDGACRHNGTSQARAGYGGYYGSLADPRNFSCPVPLTESQTNNRGEVRAVIHAIVQAFIDAGAPADALEATHLVDPSAWTLGDLTRPLPHLTIYTDSRYVIDGLTRYAKKWVLNGFVLSTKKPVQNQDLWKQLIRLRDRYNTLYARQQHDQQCARRCGDGHHSKADVAEPVQYTCHNTKNDKSEGMELIHVRGHSKVHGNEMADSLAVMGSRLHTS
ncbi:ribonuclease H1, putative [Leishmania tarentolae]|uniref:ribonuclease H n=1 Tax=Leishmania tarentolae TaxID=5689 RepID=A0A640K9U6_LEITA|nr:ribonuclease H1, putative [Leishmania tarentolae]